VAARKTARIVSTEAIGPDVRLLALEPSEPLGFVGGQYLIVDSGVLLANGKAAKRAYSILSSDEQQGRIEIAVKRIGNGPASSFLHAQPVGSEVPFSGPWGKYLPDDARPRRTWVIATDTGITAALGLVRGRAFVPQRAQTQIVWLLERDDYFLPPGWVRERAGVPMAVERVPPVGHVERPEVACSIVARRLAGPRADSVFLSGDGALLYPLRDQLVAAGVPLESIRLECFFNNPEKLSK
jgi:ferredoxin-NADP reductase